MRDAVLLGALVPAAGGDVDADRGRAQPRHRLDGDAQAVRQVVDLDAHRTASRPITPRSRARSFGDADRSARGRVIRSASRGGSAGRTPQAASTASGNFAGCAVASTTIGTRGSPRRTPRGVERRPRCAGRRPRRSSRRSRRWPRGSRPRRRGRCRTPRAAASSAPWREREAARVARARPSAPPPPRPRGRRARTAAARSSS